MKVWPLCYCVAFWSLWGKVSQAVATCYSWLLNVLIINQFIVMNVQKKKSSLQFLWAQTDVFKLLLFQTNNPKPKDSFIYCPNWQIKKEHLHLRGWSQQIVDIYLLDKWLKRLIIIKNSWHRWLQLGDSWSQFLCLCDFFTPLVCYSSAADLKMPARANSESEWRELSPGPRQSALLAAGQQTEQVQRRDSSHTNMPWSSTKQPVVRFGRHATASSSFGFTVKEAFLYNLPVSNSSL